MAVNQSTPWIIGTLRIKKVLVPFVKEIVPVIEIKEKWLLINPPPGLLEL